MIGGGDVSAFAGIFVIIAVFIVIVVLGLIAGAIILIVMAAKKQAPQNQVLEKHCVKCGAVIAEGDSFCTQCGAPAIEHEPLEDRSDFQDIHQDIHK